MHIQLAEKSNTIDRDYRNIFLPFVKDLNLFQKQKRFLTPFWSNGKPLAQKAIF